MLQDVRNLQHPCRLQHQSLDVTALPPLWVLLFMQLNYDSAAQRVGTEQGLKCSNESNQGFFSIGGVLWMSSSSISGMCLGLFRDVKTKDVSSIFTVCFVFSSLGRIFGLLSRTSPDLEVFITNWTSVERHSRWVLMWQCFYCVQILLAVMVKHFWTVPLCQLDLAIVGSTVCCLSLKVILQGFL